MCYDRLVMNFLGVLHGRFLCVDVVPHSSQENLRELSFLSEVEAPLNSTSISSGQSPQNPPYRLSFLVSLPLQNQQARHLFRVLSYSCLHVIKSF